MNFFLWLRSFIVGGLAQLFNVTIMDRGGSTNGTIHIRSGQTKVNGFMRDYKLLSKIPGHLWVGGATRDVGFNNEIITVTGNATNTPFVGQPSINIISASGDSVTRSADELHQSPDSTDALLLSPKQVYQELKTVPTPFTLENLDAKISTYAKIADLIRVDSSGGNRETIKDVLQRLKNRKKYAANKKGEQKFFGAYKNTTDELVTELLEKHKHLKIGPADDFIPEFPVDAHATMIAYSDAVVALCGAKPIFYLIAKATDFKTKEGDRRKRDPILLVQSPFGLYWQILGAWDEEMILVNDL